MKTDDLIETLTADLAPAPPLPRPAWRAGVWLLGSVLYLAVLTLSMARHGIAIEGAGALFLVSQLAAVATGALAALAAFASVVPGYSLTVFVWPVAAAGVWLGALAAGGLGRADLSTVAAASNEWVCVAVIVLGGAPLVAVLMAMLRRGAPLRPGVTAALAAVAVGALANVGACFSRPHVDDAVTLVWHGGAVLASMLLCIGGARYVFRWRRAARR